MTAFTSHGKLTTNRNLCVYPIVLCFISEGPVTGLEHLVSKSDCKEVIFDFVEVSKINTTSRLLVRMFYLLVN